jgi:serine protease Do
MSGTMIVNNTGISESVSKIYDSVVMIKNLKNGKDNGSGSGFVYKKDSKYGYIMTNQHVVDDATGIKILLTSGEEVEGTILGGDEYLDIAVIRIPAEKVISVASIGSTENLKLGEQIFAIGTPVGEEYFNTVTSGYVSGIDRKVTVSVKSNNDWVQEVIQIDASINPGNSGGPLVNYNGEVIGINSMKLVDSSIEGMGFSIKIEDAMKHISTLENGKGISRPLLGITHCNVSDTYTLKRYGITLDSSIDEGIVVISVEDGSGASKAGLKKGDVIVKLNDDDVTDMAYLKYLLYKYNAGDTINLTYIRNSKTKTTKVTLTENSN